MDKVSLKRLRFYTKKEEELIPYRLKGAEISLPQVFVYEHFGSEEEALKAFMSLESFCMAETGDSFIAFPLKGACKVGGFSVLRFRVEKGKVYELNDYCTLCKFKIKKQLSGCEPCQGLKGLKQLNPLVVKNVKKSTLELADHHEDRRAAYKRRDGDVVDSTSSLLQ